MRKVFVFVVCSIVSFAGIAQSLTGIWRGSFYNRAELLMFGSRYRYEVQIKETKGAVKGVTYSYQDTRFYGKASAVGKYSTGQKNLILKESSMMELKIDGGGDGCLMTCYLEYQRAEGKEFLVGTYTSVSMHNDSLSCGGGVVRLEKVPDSDFAKEDFLVVPEKKVGIKPGQQDALIKKPATVQKPPAATTQKKPLPQSSVKTPAPKKPAPKTAAKPTPKPQPKTPANSTAKSPTPQKPAQPLKKTLPPATANSDNTAETKPKTNTAPVPRPATIKNRTNELVDVVDVNSRNIVVSLYDNGDIDGDTISVYFNNRLIASRRGLSAQPIELKLRLEDDDTHELVMVAENLGSIPPNTALLIVQAGTERHTLRLASTEQKNAMVRFRYKSKDNTASQQ